MKKQLLLLAAGLMLGSAAADAAWTTGKEYYFDPSACSWYNNSSPVTVISYDGISVVTEKQNDGICKFTLTVAPTGNVTVQRKENATTTTVWNSISVSAPANDSQNLIKSNNNFNGYSWETYTATVISGTWSTTKDYYFVSSACGWLLNDGAELKAWDGKSNVAMELVKAGVYKFRLTNPGDNGYVEIRRCQPGTGSVWNKLSVAATDDASQNQIACNGEFTSYTWGVYDAEAPEPEGITIYWDNSVAKWATPYVYYWGASTASWPGKEMTNVDGNVWTYELPAGTTAMLFNAGDGDATKTGDMDVVANHIYNQSGDQGEYTGNLPEPGPEPGIDYTTWYLNVIGSNFKDADVPGVSLDADGKATVKNVPVGKGTFEIKIWNSKDGDVYYSNGGAVALNEWTVIPGSKMVQMTIQGASEDSLYDIAWNEADHAVYVTQVGGTIPDDPQPGNNYAGWYLNVIGDNGNLVDGVELAEDGTATALDVHIGTGTFEIKIWNSKDGDVYYSNGGEVATDEWVVLPFSSGVQMTVAGAEENYLYSVAWDQKTTSVKVVKTGTTGVEAVEAAEEAVYFTLQGVKVANPENGLYIKVVNGKATKVLVK